MTEFGPEELALVGLSSLDPGWTSLPMPAEIDVVTAGQVRFDLQSAVDRGHQVVIADMRSTQFCDCAGVAALYAVRQYAARYGAELRIVARAAPVLRVFRLTGLLPIIAVSEPAAPAQRDLDDGTSLAQPVPN